MSAQLNPKIFKAYDIRGIYPLDINEENIATIIRAIYTFYRRQLKKQNLTVVLGRDMRISSPALAAVAGQTLMDMGAKVIDAGLVSTPTFYFSVLAGKYDAGIQISASHNPKDYNGIKFVYRNGDKLVKVSQNAGMDEVKNSALLGQFAPAVAGGETQPRVNFLDQELETVLSEFDATAFKPLRVVADAANAMGSLYIDALFKKVPGELIRMNFALDGTFPSHQADPFQPKNVVDLQKKVTAEKADLGMEPDGDGDRIFFVDEKGKIIPPTVITALITREILKTTPGAKILVDVRYTKNVVNVIKKLGGQAIISKVGHALITEQLNREGAVFAGESSGHYYFAKQGGTESSLRAIGFVLEVISKEAKPISEIVAGLSSAVESGEYNFELPESPSVKEILAGIVKDYQSGQLSTLDGITIEFPAWRFNIRTSNTEPLMRLNVEGDDEAVVKEKLLELKEKILAYKATEKE
ncbi:phosphomannomutase/phosphoglucomutase [Candidatus Roizmanbacteria bacterium]|nr:phosphomannomutase/phosphoglucomutase [Candidatus Roizmanbacteria bacterium]